MAAASAPVSAASAPVSQAPASASAAALPPTPRVGMQDGWFVRPGNQGCAGNEENSLAAPVPPPNYHTTIPTAVDDGRNWADLNIRYLRITIPWDIAYHHDHPIRVAGKHGSYTLDPNRILQVEQLCLDYWLGDINNANAVRAGKRMPPIEPQVQFRPDYNDLGTKILRHSRSTVIVVPSIETYRKAIQAFIHTYSCATSSGQPLPTCPRPTSLPQGLGVRAMTRVSTLTPWGEPDFYNSNGKPHATGARDGQFYMPVGTRRFDQPGCESGTDTCGPVLAAQMWVATARRCHGCMVIAGTFSSNSGTKASTYLRTYAKHLDGLRPAVWAIDPYTDIDAFEYGCWNQRPRSSSAVGTYPANPPTPPHAHCPTPFKQSTLVWKYSTELATLGYRSHTRIWLGEISTFYIDTIAHPGAWYGFQVQHQAADYLLKQLAKPGASTPPADPYVARLYYMRYADGAGYPDFALVLANPATTQQGPVAPGAEWRTPAYAAFQFRSAPQQ